MTMNRSGSGSGVPDFLSPAAWDPLSATQAIKSLQQQVLDLQRATSPDSASGNVATTDSSGRLIDHQSGFGIGVALVSGAYVPVATVSVRTKGGWVELTGFATVVETKSAPAIYDHRYRIMRDGSELLSFCDDLGHINIAAAKDTTGSLVAEDQPSPGGHTYTIEARYDAASTSGTPAANGYLLSKEYSQ